MEITNAPAAPDERDKALVGQLLRHYQIECGPLNAIQKDILESSVAAALATVRAEGNRNVASMRSACIETIRGLRPTAAGAGAFKDAAIKALESVTIQEQEKQL